MGSRRAGGSAPGEPDALAARVDVASEINVIVAARPHAAMRDPR